MKKTLTLFLSALAAWGCEYDDTGLWDRTDELDERLTAVEKRLDEMNGEITALRTIVEAVENGKYVKEVERTDTGYIITFSDGSTITLMNGRDGDDAPVIGIAADDEGNYWWTVTENGRTEWLTDDEGNRLPVSGEKGITPRMGVDGEGYWTVDYGDGPVRLTGPDGQPVPARGEAAGSFITDIRQDEGNVYFVLADGSTITVPKISAPVFKIEGADKTVIFLYGQSVELNVVRTGVTELTITRPDGWRASVNGDRLSIKAPERDNPYAETEGKVTVIAAAEGGAVAMASVKVTLKTSVTVTFEGIDPSYLAGPTSYGANLYSGHENQYTGYYDEESGLYMGINEAGGSYDYWNGGIAVSQWNEMATSSYTNQCSVYYRDPATGCGGNGGSQTFGVSFGYYAMMGTCPRMEFLDDSLEREFSHIYVANSTYAALTVRNGDGWACAPLCYDNRDWFRLTATGYGADGTETGKAEFYLADYRTEDSPGLVTGWQRFDLSSLGKVHRIEFDMDGSSKNAYGLTTPAYFCLDDIKIKL